jgi:hypothetical protein
VDWGGVQEERRSERATRVGLDRGKGRRSGEVAFAVAFGRGEKETAGSGELQPPRRRAVPCRWGLSRLSVLRVLDEMGPGRVTSLVALLARGSLVIKTPRWIHIIL